MITLKEKLTAIKGSVDKWDKVSKREIEDEGTDNCPLCKIHCKTYRTADIFAVDTFTCNGCPIYEKIGISGCDGTLYLAYKKALKKETNCSNETTWAITDQAARTFRDWLKDLYIEVAEAGGIVPTIGEDCTGHEEELKKSIDEAREKEFLHPTELEELLRKMEKARDDVWKKEGLTREQRLDELETGLKELSKKVADSAFKEIAHPPTVGYVKQELIKLGKRVEELEKEKIAHPFYAKLAKLEEIVLKPMGGGLVTNLKAAIQRIGCLEVESASSRALIEGLHILTKSRTKDLVGKIKTLELRMANMKIVVGSHVDEIEELKKEKITFPVDLRLNRLEETVEVLKQTHDEKLKEKGGKNGL